MKHQNWLTVVNVSSQNEKDALIAVARMVFTTLNNVFVQVVDFNQSWACSGSSLAEFDGGETQVGHAGEMVQSLRPRGFEQASSEKGSMIIVMDQNADGQAEMLERAMILAGDTHLATMTHSQITMFYLQDQQQVGVPSGDHVKPSLSVSIYSADKQNVIDGLRVVLMHDLQLCAYAVTTSDGYVEFVGPRRSIGNAEQFEFVQSLPIAQLVNCIRHQNSFAPVQLSYVKGHWDVLDGHCAVAKQNDIHSVIVCTEGKWWLVRNVQILTGQWQPYQCNRELFGLSRMRQLINECADDPQLLDQVTRYFPLNSKDTLLLREFKDDDKSNLAMVCRNVLSTVTSAELTQDQMQQVALMISNVVTLAQQQEPTFFNQHLDAVELRNRYAMLLHDVSRVVQTNAYKSELHQMLNDVVQQMVQMDEAHVYVSRELPKAQYAPYLKAIVTRTSGDVGLASQVFGRLKSMYEKELKIKRPQLSALNSDFRAVDWQSPYQDESKTWETSKQSRKRQKFGAGMNFVEY